MKLKLAVNPATGSVVKRVIKKAKTNKCDEIKNCTWDNYIPVTTHVTVCRFYLFYLFIYLLALFLYYYFIYNLAPAVQKADNSIQCINRYPVDKMYSNQYILSAGESYSLFDQLGPGLQQGGDVTLNMKFTRTRHPSYWCSMSNPFRICRPSGVDGLDEPLVADRFHPQYDVRFQNIVCKTSSSFSTVIIIYYSSATTYH